MYSSPGSMVKQGHGGPASIDQDDTACYWHFNTVVAASKVTPETASLESI